jgi:competence/damage-inducible protein CinA-like protein
MPSCEIITIGTEILLGEITDTNSRYLARALRDLGIDLYRKTTIGDNARRIAQAIQEALNRSDIVLTTGGLGPTVDDPTREAVALAVGCQVEYRPELWEQIQRRFERFGRQPTENNKRQAFVPAGAIPVENAVGTAPAFFFETQNGKVIISLPGVPREMEYLLQHKVIPYLRQRYDLRGIIKARVLHTSGLGESVIDDLIGDLETLTNPTVGLAAHSGQVDVRITAKAGSEAEADAMIAELEAAIRQRLEKAIYGVNEETLEASAAKNIRDRGWRLAVVEYGLGGELLSRLASVLFGDLAGGKVLAEAPEPERRREIVEEYRSNCSSEAALGVFLTPAGEKQEIFIIITTPVGVQEYARPYGGPPSSAPAWGINTVWTY